MKNKWIIPVMAMLASSVAVRAPAGDCTALGEGVTAEISVAASAAAAPTTVTLLLDYAAAELSVPGTRNLEPARARLVPAIEEVIAVINDMDGTARVVLAGTKPLSPGVAARLTFDRCSAEASVAKITCTVEGCAGVDAVLADCVCTVR